MALIDAPGSAPLVRRAKERFESENETSLGPLVSDMDGEPSSVEQTA